MRPCKSNCANCSEDCHANQWPGYQHDCPRARNASNVESKSEGASSDRAVSACFDDSNGVPETCRPIAKSSETSTKPDPTLWRITVLILIYFSQRSRLTTAGGECRWSAKNNTLILTRARSRGQIRRLHAIVMVREHAIFGFAHGKSSGATPILETGGFLMRFEPRYLICYDLFTAGVHGNSRCAGTSGGNRWNFCISEVQVTN